MLCSADNAFEIIHINEFTQEKIKAEQAKYCEDHTIGKKKHALKIYDLFLVLFLSTSYHLFGEKCQVK